MWSSGDFPTVAAQRIHQLNRPLDELGRLVDFFHRLAAVWAGDDDSISPAAFSQDFVPQSFAVSIEKPNHPAEGYNKETGADAGDFVQRRACAFSVVRVR
jgi:hypothetical protein